MRTKKSKIKNRKTKNKYRIKGGVASARPSNINTSLKNEIEYDLKQYMYGELHNLRSHINGEISELNIKIETCCDDEVRHSSDGGGGGNENEEVINTSPNYPDNHNSWNKSWFEK
jgi:hypothetical protein